MLTFLVPLVVSIMPMIMTPSLDARNSSGPRRHDIRYIGGPVHVRNRNGIGRHPSLAAS